jgi:hypothetical protein
MFASTLGSSANPMGVVLDLLAELTGCAFAIPEPRREVIDVGGPDPQAIEVLATQQVHDPR